MAAAQILVRGVVQGVGYRAWTERTALSLGISGWVRNLADGRVEVFAEGDDAALAELAARCEDGPSGAEVDEVVVSSRPSKGIAGFRVERSALAPD